MAGWLSALKKELTGESGNTVHAPQRAWSRQVFEGIEWRRFEALCEALFGQAGVRTESQSHGADGGVDIWLYSAQLEAHDRSMQALAPQACRRPTDARILWRAQGQ